MQKPEDFHSEIAFLSTQELSELLNVTTRWLRYNRTQENYIPYVKFGRLVRYQRKDITEWLRKNNKI